MRCSTCSTYTLEPSYNFCTICGTRQPKAKLLAQFHNEEAYNRWRAKGKRPFNSFIEKVDGGHIFVFVRPQPGEELIQ